MIFYEKIAYFVSSYVFNNFIRFMEIFQRNYVIFKKVFR